MSATLDLKVLIVGGGLVGCACGHFLAQRGAGVTILEQTYLASGASGANAGFLSVGPVDSVQKIKLFKEARRMVQEELAGRISSFEYIHGGLLYVALNDREEDELLAKAEALHEQGIESEFLQGKVLLKREPILSRKIPYGLYIPSTGHFNPFLLNHAFADSVIQKGGKVYQGVRVFAIEPGGNGFLVRSDTETFSADAVVLATGWQASELAKPLGLSVPVIPARGQVIVSEPLGPITQKIITTLHDNYVRQTVSGTCQIGSQLELVGPVKTVTLPTLRELAERISEVVPFFRNVRMLRAYAGLRPLSPDSMAIVGEAPGIKGLFLAYGHSRTGATTSTLSGRVISELIIDGSTAVDISLWDPARFEGKTFEELNDGR